MSSSIEASHASVSRNARGAYPAAIARRIVFSPSAMKRPSVGLSGGAQLDVAELGEVTQARVGGVGQAFDGHEPDGSWRPSLSTGA